MRSRVLAVGVGLAATLLSGCGSDPFASGESAASVEPTVASAEIAPETAFGDQVEACVKQGQFGAYFGDANWTEVWKAAGATEIGMRAWCEQAGAADPASLVQMHEDWSAFQAYVSSTENAGAAEAAIVRQCSSADWQVTYQTEMSSCEEAATAGRQLAFNVGLATDPASTAADLSFAQICSILQGTETKTAIMQANIDLADGLLATGVCPGNREMLIHTPE